MILHVITVDLINQKDGKQISLAISHHDRTAAVVFRNLLKMAQESGGGSVRPYDSESFYHLTVLGVRGPAEIAVPETKS